MNYEIAIKALDACVEYRKQLDEKTAEVARLRDEIQKLKDQPHFHHESYCRKCHEVVTNNV